MSIRKTFQALTKTYLANFLSAAKKKGDELKKRQAPVAWLSLYKKSQRLGRRHCRLAKEFIETQ
jgi:hypothetical protein